MRIEGNSAVAVSQIDMQNSAINRQNAAKHNASSAAEKSSASKVEHNDGFIELSQKPKEELTISEKAWIDIVERANKAIMGATCTFEYSIHEETKEIMVKVIDKDTKEIIREIPPEKILDMVAKMWEIAGIMVDERR